jgi:hypothetical protein
MINTFLCARGAERARAAARMRASGLALSHYQAARARAAAKRITNDSVDAAATAI